MGLGAVASWVAGECGMRGTHAWRPGVCDVGVCDVSN